MPCVKRGWTTALLFYAKQIKQQQKYLLRSNNRNFVINSQGIPILFSSFLFYFIEIYVSLPYTRSWAVFFFLSLTKRWLWIFVRSFVPRRIEEKKNAARNRLATSIFIKLHLWHSTHKQQATANAVGLRTMSRRNVSWVRRNAVSKLNGRRCTRFGIDGKTSCSRQGIRNIFREFWPRW